MALCTSLRPRSGRTPGRGSTRDFSFQEILTPKFTFAAGLALILGFVPARAANDATPTNAPATTIAATNAVAPEAQFSVAVPSALQLPSLFGDNMVLQQNQRVPVWGWSQPEPTGLVGGTFFTTASHGTDQLIVQRLLAARTQKQSVTALLSSGVAIFFLFALFLLVGVMLFAFYGVPSSAFGKADRIYPTFIVHQMPHGISGLLIAAILAAAMSNLSAALNSLSSSSMVDFYLRNKPAMEESRKILLSRIATLLWALLLFALAVLSLHKVGHVVEVGLQIASVAYGALLGVFLLGVLTRRANQNGAMAGMLCGFAIELYLWLATPVPWTWYVAIGTVLTFLVGYAVSVALQPKSI